MIITRAEAKTFLGLSDTTYDTFIDLNIPMVEETICKYCRNDFIDTVFDYFVSSAIEFINSDNSINLTNIGNYKLVSGDSIRVYRSLRNNQTFTIHSVDTNKLILSDIDSVTDEDEGESVYVTKITYPRNLKLTASKMLKFLISEMSDNNNLTVKSEKIDDYSITFDRDNYFMGFPIGIMSPLNEYRVPYYKDLFFKMGV